MKELLANGQVIESHGPWQLIRDEITPYCWLIKRGPRHLKRFIREDEARNYYKEMVDTDD